MGISITSKDYNDVRMTIHRDKKSGIITCRTYTIRRNARQVADRLTVMCLKHDLKCTNVSSMIGEKVIVCSIKVFGSIDELIEHIKAKAVKTKYSWRIRGSFALAKIGDNEYIYRIKSTC